VSEGLPDWVLEAEEEIVEQFDAMLAPLVAKAIEIHVGSFTADAADAVTVEWHLAVEEFIADDVSDVWLTAVLEASGQVPETPADFPEVVNKNGIEYQQQATNRIVGATNDLWGEINDQIVTNLVMGMDVADLADEVEKISGFSSRRAAAIARTETLAAYNNGDWAGVKALGEFGPTHKQWLASGAVGQYRPTHLKVSGTVLEIDEPFQVGDVSMMRPHEPGSPASEVVNCRCTTLQYWPGDELPDGSIIPERAAPEDE